MKWNYLLLSSCSQETLECVYNSLSPTRKAHIDRMKREQARRQSLAGELLARQLLLELGLPEPVIHRAENGRPYVDGDRAYISIAHSGELVVCAAAFTPIGIDAEQLRPIHPGLPERVCVPQELEYVGRDTHRFFEIWTAKEAYFKKLGTGITDFQSVNTLELPRTHFMLHDCMVQIIT